MNAMGWFGSLMMFVAACGGSDSPLAGDSTLDINNFAGAAGSMAAPAAQRWSGIEACSGSVNEKDLERTSVETSIDAFDKTPTRVTIAGVRVGPSAAYSCDEPVTFEGVVTSTLGDDSLMFKSAGDDVAHQLLCSSSKGTALTVGWLDGYDTDQRVWNGSWDLHFDIRITEPVDTQAEGNDVRASKFDIRCRFDLALR